MTRLSFFALAAALTVTATAQHPIPLGTAHRLFLDDFVVAESNELMRQIHPVTKSPANPVIWPEEEWEYPYALLYGSVIREDDGYRMWYLSRRAVHYAESEDGVAWTKPTLGLFKLDGHDTNAVVQREGENVEASLPYFYELFGVLRDDKETDPAWRYKMGYLSIERGYEGPRMDPFHRGQRRGLGVAVSPDGLNWSGLEPWTTEAICDGASHWMYDTNTSQYVLFGRTKLVDEELVKAWGENEHVKKYYWGRSVARTESPDFLDWDFEDPASAPVVMVPDANDPPGTEIYGMAVFPYESIYIGLVQRFLNDPVDNRLDIQLAVSHDGKSFERVSDRTPFIPCGPVGSWDRYNNAMANNPPIPVGDNLRFYYSGRTYRHGPYDGPDKGVIGGGIGFAEIQRDRFVSLGASFSGGSLTTKPMQLEGKTLHINGDSDFGSIMVEALNDSDEIIATSRLIRQDGLDIAVEWETGALPEAGNSVRLRFTLANALLFSFWAE
jgi:hypothetical protein